MAEIVDCIAWIVRKFFWSLGVFLKFLGLRCLDLLGLIFNLLACATILRLPAMCWQFAHMRNMLEWRFIGIVQFFIFIMDIPIIIMALIIFVTIIRIYPFMQDMQKSSTDFEFKGRHDIFFSGIDVRRYIVKNFFVLFMDLFCLSFLIVVVLSWRSCRFFRKFNNATSEWEKRGVIFLEFVNLLWDIPLIVFFIISLCTWRLPFVVIDVHDFVQRGKSWNKIRYFGIYHFSLALVDIPCIIVFLVTLVTWRSPVLVWSLIGHDIFARASMWKEQWKVRSIVWQQFLYLFVDIPTIVCGLFVVVTVMRLPTMVVNIREIVQKERERRDRGESSKLSAKNFYKIEFPVRGIIFKEFAMFWLDLVMIVLGVIVFVTLWRADPLAKDIKKYSNQWDNPKKKEKKQSTAVDNQTTTTDEVVEMAAAETSGNAELPPPASHVQGESTPHVELSTEGKEEEEEKKKLKWSAMMWKIRRQIAFHFMMLLVDIPAVPLCLLVLLTGLRTSKLVSALIGGQFYMLFAASVYVETAKLFRDICFIFLFLLLMLLRPIQSWVHLLEDEEHREYRILTDLVVWVPDICSERQLVYEVIEDRLTLYVKQQKSELFVTEVLNKIIGEHLQRIQRLLSMLDDFDIEGEFNYLLQNVKFIEEKRVTKMLRKFKIEQNYIERCAPTLHTQNLRKYKDEMRRYDDEVLGAYQILEMYKPDKVPLYAVKCGLKMRSGSETRKVLIDCLPRGRFLVNLMIVLCTLMIYRAPQMFKSLHRKPYDRFRIAVHTLKEYAKDGLTFLQMLLVLIFLYRAPIMLADVIDCLVEKRSWKAVREIVKRHPPSMLSDLGHVLKKLLTWETPRFIITMTLFGILMPAELFLSVVKIGVGDHCCAYFLTVLLYAVFVVGPFFVTLYVAEILLHQGMGWVISVIILVIVLLLLFQLLIMIVSMTKDENKKFLMEMPECDYVHLNWSNMHVLLFELLEFLQSLALVFKFQRIPMYGGSVLSTIAAYLLFSFFSFYVIFWITVVVFIIWFFLCGAPHIFDNILKNDRTVAGTIAKRTSWRLSLSLLANTLFVTIIESMTSALACNYHTCPAGVLGNSTYVNVTNSTASPSLQCVAATLVEDSSIPCWVGSHQGYATFALVGIVWYSTTSLIFGTQYGDPDNKDLDIGFSPIYNMIINVFKAGMILVAAVVTDSPYVVLALLAAGYLLCLFYTAAFKRLFHHKPCNLHSVLVWRFCTFISCIFACIAVVVAFVLNDNQSIIPLLIFLIGTFLTFFVSVIAAFKLSQTSSLERHRNDFKTEIVILEARMASNKWMHKRWEKEEKTWYRLVSSVHEAHKEDKVYESETILTSAVATAPILPPPYQANNGDGDSDNLVITDVSTPSPSDEFVEVSPPSYNMDVPPPPSYNENDAPPPAIDIPPPPPPPSYDSDDRFTELSPTNIGEAPPNYQSTASSNFGGAPNYYIPDDVIFLEKNGRNLLLIFEKYIMYTAYKYASLSQRNIWINMVTQSNWTGLLHELRILNNNLTGAYNKPSQLDIKLANLNRAEYDLPDDSRDLEEPPNAFIKKTKEDIARESDEIRDEALTYFGSQGQYSEKWRILIDKLLPTGPVFKYCSTTTDSFHLILRRPATGVISEYEEPGLKIAVGASFTIGKKLDVRFKDDECVFQPGSEPVGKKGPVSVAVDKVSLVHKNGELYVMVKGKKVKFTVALASCKTIKWS